MTTVVNPYARRRRPFAMNQVNQVTNQESMGRQSQHRISNQHKRKYKLCSKSPKKRRKGDQLMLQGAVAFDPERDCIVCRAKSHKKFFPSYTVPHRGHDPCCLHNKSTRVQGALVSQPTSVAEDKRYKQLTRPIQQSEKFSGSNLTTAAAFFAPKQTKKATTITTESETEPVLV